MSSQWTPGNRGSGRRPRQFAAQNPSAAAGPSGSRRGSRRGQRGPSYFSKISPRRKLFGAVLACGFAIIAWHIFRDTAAYNLAATDPQNALFWNANEATALDELALAEIRKTGGDLEIARNAAVRSLQQSPLDPVALSALGLIADRGGDPARAAILMNLADSVSRHDTPSQGWLINNDLKRARYGDAMRHLDVLLRTNLGAEELGVKLISAYMIDRPTFSVLEASLATNPPWRQILMPSVIAQFPNLSRLEELYADLKSSPYPLDKAELTPLILRLVDGGRYGSARNIWLATLPAGQAANPPALYNGNFDKQVDGLPFNWRLVPAAGMDLKIVALPDAPGARGLQFQFSGARVEPFEARQAVMLRPGQYVFSGKVMALSLSAPRGLWWRVSCAGSDKTLGTTSLLTESTPWRDFSVSFEVPAENCAAQWLKAEIPSRVGSESQIEGQAWFAGFKIDISATPGSVK